MIADREHEEYHFHLEMVFRCGADPFFSKDDWRVIDVACLGKRFVERVVSNGRDLRRAISAELYSD